MLNASTLTRFTNPIIGSCNLSSYEVPTVGPRLGNRTSWACCIAQGFCRRDFRRDDVVNTIPSDLKRFGLRMNNWLADWLEGEVTQKHSGGER